MRKVSGVVASLALCTLAVASASPPARARLYERSPGRVELGLEVAFWALDFGHPFAALEPDVLFGLSGGIYVAPSWRLGVVARAAISEPQADHVEALADLTWSTVIEPRIPDPPAPRFALSLEVGWRWSELHGSDFVVTDQGLLATLGGDVGIVVFEDVALSLQAAMCLTSSDNGARDPWAAHVRVGFTLATIL